MILLDTHTLIWLDQGLEQLGEKARETIEVAYRKDEIAVSSVTFWEVSQLMNDNRLGFEGDLAGWRVELLASGFVELVPDGSVVLAAAGLRSFTGDAIDRLLAATAMNEEAPLVTADPFLLRRRSVPTIDATV